LGKGKRPKEDKLGEGASAKTQRRGPDGRKVQKKWGEQDGFKGEKETRTRRKCDGTLRKEEGKTASKSEHHPDCEILRGGHAFLFGNSKKKREQTKQTIGVSAEQETRVLREGETRTTEEKGRGLSDCDKNTTKDRRKKELKDAGGARTRHSGRYSVGICSVEEEKHGRR